MNKLDSKIIFGHFLPISISFLIIFCLITLKVWSCTRLRRARVAECMQLCVLLGLKCYITQTLSLAILQVETSRPHEITDPLLNSSINDLDVMV